MENFPYIEYILVVFANTKLWCNTVYVGHFTLCRTIIFFIQRLKKSAKRWLDETFLNFSEMLQIALLYVKVG